MYHARTPRSLLLLVALLLPSLASAQHVPVGKEFQVNSYTGGNQVKASLATDADGDFVVAWHSYDGELTGIFAQRFSSAGALLGNELQVNSYTPGHQFGASVAMENDGDFVVAWISRAQDGDLDGVFARRFSSAGTLLAIEFQVNSFTASRQEYPAVASDADGDFEILWESEADHDGSGPGIFGRRFSSSGAALGAEFQVNAFTAGDQRAVAASADAAGDFVVAWQSRNQDGQGYGIFGRRFSSSGTALATEFQVNSHTDSYQTRASVAHDGAGRFVIAWEDQPHDGSDYGVFARAFASDGTALATEFQVNVHTTNSQRKASVAATSDGFVVAWYDTGEDGSLEGVFARRVSSAGVPLATEFQVNTYTANSQREPVAAGGAGGDFVVAWASNYQDDSAYGIFGQRFAVGIALDIDGDGTVQPLTDGLLFLRFAFLFSGSTLVNGAVDTDCSRCDSSTIAPYLSGLGLALDIDGNGAVGALTDGLLVLRYLFGFTGATLTTGAVAGNCSRCDATAIVPYLDGLNGS